MTAHNFMRRDAQKYLKVLSSDSRAALAKARPTSSQTLDVWENIFFFPLVNVL